MKRLLEKIQGVLVPLALVLFGLICPMTEVCRAQATQQFTGHVLDSAGAVVPDADVTVHNEGTGIDSKTVTTNTGDYTVSYLNPGTYDITVSKAGFQTLTKASITLNVAQKSTIDFSLTVGAVTQNVTVNSSAVQLDLTSSDRGVIINQEMVNELPLDSQDPYMLLDLTPGTHDFTNPIYPRPFDNPTGNQYANGSPQVSQLNVDGGTNDVADVGRYGFVPSVESVQEFKVVLNAYDASYGHSGGSSVDMQIKSGGNSFHGSAYEFARRGGLDAGIWQNNYNNIHPARAPHYRDQYGFEADGPVIIPKLFNGKDRLFYTIQYERMNDILPSQGYNVQSIPNPQWLSGNFGYFDPANPFTSGPSYYNNVTHSLQPVILYDPLTPLTSTVDPNCIANGGSTSSCTKLMHQAFPGNIVPTNRIDPVGATILSYYKYLTPNINNNASNLQPGTAPWTNNWQTLQVENDAWRSAMAKIDYTITPKDKAYVRWSDQYRYSLTNNNDGYPANDPANMNSTGRQPQSMQGAVQWTHIFSPTLLFQLSATADKYNNVQFLGQTFSGNEYAALGFAGAFTNQLDPGNIHRFPYINPSGVQNADTYGWFGSNSGIGFNGDTRTLTFNPSLTLIHGAHSMRFGANINFDQWDQPFGGSLDTFSFTNNFTSEWGPGYSDQSGYYSGDSIASLLLGYPNGGTVNQNIHYFYSQHYFAPWFQDDWKITKRLTLNLGLRWDYETPRIERHNKQTGMFLTNVVNPISSQIPSGTVLGNSTILNGGLTFAGVNGQSTGAFHPSKLNFEPRIGFAWNVIDRLVLRGGFGETILGDEINNGTSGFSASTGYTNSNDGGITPYTVCPQGAATPGYPNCTGGLGLANPIASVAQPTGSSLGLLQNLGSSISFYNPNYRTPQFWNYSLELDARLSKRDTATIAYVGDREPNASVSNDLNHVSPAYNAMCDPERGGNHLLCDASGAQLKNPFKGLGPAGSGYYSASTISPGFLTRPYPEFQTVTENGWANIGKNWYNSFQATFGHQVSRSLTAHFTYTHARALASSGFIDTVNQIYLPRQVSTSNDVNHSITFDAVGYVPVGRGRLLLTNANPLIDAVIGGWEISPILTYYSGFAWRPSNSQTWEMAQTGAPITQSMAVAHTILPPDANHKNYRIRGVNPCVGTRDPVSNAIIPGPSAVAAGCGTPSQVLFVTSASSSYSLARPNETFGVRQPGAYTFNSSFSKNFHIPGATHAYLSENTNLQVRVDLLNVFNHPNWDEGYNSSPSSIDFGTIGKGPNAPTNTPRYVQLSAKLSW